MNSKHKNDVGIMADLDLFIEWGMNDKFKKALENISLFTQSNDYSEKVIFLENAISALQDVLGECRELSGENDPMKKLKRQFDL